MPTFVSSYKIEFFSNWSQLCSGFSIIDMPIESLSDKVQPTDKVQPENRSAGSGSVSVPKDTIQNDDIQVKVKVTDDTHAEQESDETDELFDDSPLDTIPYDPKNENWHDDLSILDGSKMAFNQQSLMTRINTLADALAKNMSEPCTSTLQWTQSVEKPPSQTSSQALLHNGSNEDDKDSGMGSLGLKASSSCSNNAVPKNESEDTEKTGLAIFHALPFKDQVQYFSDYLRAGAEKRNQT